MSACMYIYVCTRVLSSCAHASAVHLSCIHRGTCIFFRCEPPFYENPESPGDGSQCLLSDFKHVCNDSSISIGTQQLKGSSDSQKSSTGLIGDSANLTIRNLNFRNTDYQHGLTVESLPIKDKKKAMVREDGEASLTMETGVFDKRHCIIRRSLLTTSIFCH